LESGEQRGWVATHLCSSLRAVDFRDFCGSGGNKSSSGGSARAGTMTRALPSVTCWAQHAFKCHSASQCTFECALGFGGSFAVLCLFGVEGHLNGNRHVNEGTHSKHVGETWCLSPDCKVGNDTGAAFDVLALEMHFTLHLMGIASPRTCSKYSERREAPLEAPFACWALCHSTDYRQTCGLKLGDLIVMELN